MSFTYKNKMTNAKEIIAEFPLTKELAQLKIKRDEEIRQVVTGQSDKLLLVIGPCSADNEDAVCDYVSRLSSLQDSISEKIILIPRIYTNKPRTTGEGYKGISHQPDPEKAPDMLAGLVALRKMHIRALSESGLPAADEMLYPENHTYLDDILSYVTIGARSVENQQHRLTVSGIDMPIGMKNPTSGDIEVMLNSVFAAQHSHTFIYQGYEVSTTGNPLTHTILRGAVNKNGHSIPNYHYEDLELLCESYGKRNLQNPMVIVDTNHANSCKRHEQQTRIAREVLHSRKVSNDIRKLVKGFMIESYIEAGAQKVGGHVYGQSITDACMGWKESEELILEIAEKA